MSHCTSHVCGLSFFVIKKLHQESLHFQQLEDELVHWCQNWNFQNGTALAWVVVLQILVVDGVMWTTPRSSLNDFSVVQMFCHFWEKSTNSFCSEKYSACVIWWLKSFLCKLVHLDTDLFISIMFEMRCTEFRIVHKAKVDHLGIPLDASLSQILDNMICLCSVVFPYRWPWGRPLLMPWFGTERRSNVHWVVPLLAALWFKKCPHVQ